MAVAVAWLSPALAASTSDCTPPELWGDGEHDDTLALNAWLDGRTVLWAQTGATVGARITDRSFRLSSAIFIQSGTGRVLERFRLSWPADGEQVSGGAIIAGDDPRQPPLAVAITKIGGDDGEGIPFESPDLSADKPAAPSDCLSS